jgi:hypothetical protein
MLYSRNLSFWPSRVAAAARVLTVMLGAACATEPSADTPAELSLYPSEPRFFGLMLGATMALPISVRNAAGAELAGAGLVWLAARDSSVVTVDPAGRVTARAMGTTWVVGTLRHGGRVLADSVQVAVTCTLELGVRLTPGSRSIAVGESFTPSVEITTCGGQLRLTDEITWATTDTSVVAVDAGTGRTTGRALGRAEVRPVGRRYGRLLGSIGVTVTP